MEGCDSLHQTPNIYKRNDDKVDAFIYKNR